MSSDDPRPGTTASIDRRVEALETVVAGIVTDLALVKQEAAHTRELMKAGFEALNSGQAATQSKLDVILANQASQVNANADPEATPAGRLLLKEIAEAKTTAEIAKASANSLALKVAAASGALAVLVFLINLFGPALRVVLGLP